MKLVNILSDVEAEILVDTLADRVADLEVETLAKHTGRCAKQSSGLEAA